MVADALADGEGAGGGAGDGEVFIEALVDEHGEVVFGGLLGVVEQDDGKGGGGDVILGGEFGEVGDHVAREFACVGAVGAGDAGGVAVLADELDLEPEGVVGGDEVAG